MSRPYSGNIRDHRDSYERVRNHGCSISVERWFNQATRRDVERLAIHFDEYGRYPKPLVVKEFAEHDEDVMLNVQTAWLNRVADELDYWQSKS